MRMITRMVLRAGTRATGSVLSAKRMPLMTLPIPSMPSISTMRMTHTMMSNHKSYRSTKTDISTMAATTKERLKTPQATRGPGTRMRCNRRGSTGTSPTRRRGVESIIRSLIRHCIGVWSNKVRMEMSLAINYSSFSDSDRSRSKCWPSSTSQATKSSCKRS